MYFSDECACRQIHSGLSGKRLKKQSNRFSIKCNPSVTSVTPPLYFALQNTPQYYGARQGVEFHIFILLLCLTPSSCGHSPLYFLMETQGERIERGILCFGIRIVLCISLLLLHDTPQCHGTRQGGG